MCACSMIGIGFVVGMEVAAGVCSGVGLRVLGGRGGFCMEYGLMWVWL